MSVHQRSRTWVRWRLWLLLALGVFLLFAWLQSRGTSEHRATETSFFLQESALARELILSPGARLLTISDVRRTPTCREVVCEFEVDGSWDWWAAQAQERISKEFVPSATNPRSVDGVKECAGDTLALHLEPISAAPLRIRFTFRACAD